MRSVLLEQVGVPLGLLALLSVPAILLAYLLRRKSPPRTVSAMFLWRDGKPVQEAETYQFPAISPRRSRWGAICHQDTQCGSQLVMQNSLEELFNLEAT